MIDEHDPDRTRHKEVLSLRSEDVPSLTELPPGCTFGPRCPFFEPGRCDAAVPELAPVPNAASGAAVACTPLTAGDRLKPYGQTLESG